MANLYEIDEEILACIDMETGEVIDVERLDALQMERDRKVENILCWIKDLKSDAAAIREEEKALASRRRVMENKEESLTRYISAFLAGQKFSSARAAASWRKSASVSFTDEAAALAWCEENAQSAVKRAAPTLDKTAIKDLIKAGVHVDGAEIVEKQNIQIK